MGEVRVRLINAWWWARLKWRPVQYVVWGGREFDWQVGSVDDRRRQRQLNAMARRMRVMAEYRAAGERMVAAMVPVAQAYRQMAVSMGRALEQMRPAFEQIAGVFGEVALAERYRELYDQKG